MAKSKISAFQPTPAIMAGKIVVAYIHTKARKMVLPIATLRRMRKYFRGTFGAEYKKVIMADTQSHNQCSASVMKKKTDPVRPIKNRNI